MVLVKTRVVNDLVDVDLVLKEANAGVYSMLGFLERNGGKYDITVNPDTTYREYWIGGALPSESIIITSDDAVDNVELRVIKRIDGKYDLKRTPRGMKSIKPPSLGSIKPPSLGSIKPPSLGSLFRKLFRIERGGSAKGGTNTEEGGRSAEIREIEQN